MSVTPEPISRNDEGQSDSIISNRTQTPEESFLFPSILRSAAYISSGGRVYRLFSDNDEISFPMASFEKTLQLDPLPEIPPLDDFVSPLENLPKEYIEEPFVNLLPDSSADLAMNPLTPTPIPQQSQQQQSQQQQQQQQQQHDLSVTKNCPQKLPQKEKGSSKNRTYKIFSELEQEEQTNTNTPTPLYQITQEKTTLKLFEVFPELTISAVFPTVTVSPTAVPATTTATTATSPAVIPMASQSVTVTPIVRMIRLEFPLRPRKQKHCFYRLPLRRQKKIQHSLPTQYNTIKPVADSEVAHEVTTDKNIDQVTLSLNTELTITPVTETLLPESSLAKSSLVTPSLPESKPNTLLFPFDKSLAAETQHSHENNSHENGSHKNGGTWRLLWQSHWPDYLKSLELAASDQICFLADHLEIQKEHKRNVISFNSFQPGDGCTTLALCAARELAERGYRLLLVDAHRQNPELPQLLHLKTNPDFYEIITLIPDRLELLPWSETSIEINSKDHITQSFTEIVGSFRDDYDFILLDNGSLVEYPFDEHIVLWREMHSDGVLLVLNMKCPPSVSVRTIAQRLFQNQINLLGIVENYV
ncbi:MAG: hypothetical protein LBC20_01750 [Planctomycetaceae bacterium]|jgi:Mrp family chromosome partitioning ATPase|nr:hypothetical protein [Planctomycetaceae bacterium]